MDEIKDKLIQVYGEDNFDRFIDSLLECPSPEIVELAVLNAIFNKIRKKLLGNKHIQGCTETLDMLLSSDLALQGAQNIDTPKIVLDEPIKTDISGSIKEAISILDNGFEYDKKDSVYSVVFRDYRYRFSRVMNSINK